MKQIIYIDESTPWTEEQEKYLLKKIKKKNGGETMNIYAKRGDKVRFSFPNNGYSMDIEIAKERLKLGEIYTVDYTCVGQSNTSVKLLEVPDRLFNSVQFEDEEDKTNERDGE